MVAPFLTPPPGRRSRPSARASLLQCCLGLFLAWLGLVADLRAAESTSTGGTVRVEVKNPKGEFVADAVASLVPLDRTPVLAPPAEPAVIVQDDEEFQPYVTAIVVGTRVHFPNRDKVAHHVYSVSPAKKFDIPRYRGEPQDTILFDKPGLVSLGCNLHDWMAAYVVVLATPHFAKSGNDGTATVGGLPPGRYRLEVWHPRARQTVQRELTIAPGDATTQVISITLGIDRRIRRAPETGAGGYK
ncbi:MAG: carboxypeptidase regulatory-like domain-containing protein [Verrucomicrobia bacterium]|nr:carboxypeptidase regulatory-like domain-containing protein [Verrucomicrobiota bacterium]